MNKINFENSEILTPAKVTIDGVDYNITPAQMKSVTNYLNANTLNQMQTNIENAIDSSSYDMKKADSGSTSGTYGLIAEYNLKNDYQDCNDVILTNAGLTSMVRGGVILNVSLRKNTDNNFNSRIQILTPTNPYLEFYLVLNYIQNTNTMNAKLYIKSKPAYTEVRGKSLSFQSSSTSNVTRTYYTNQPNITELPSGTVVKAVGQEKYSTDKIIIGEWIDGKPLYRKVVDIGNLPNATYKNVAHGLTNFAIRKIYGMANYQQTYIPLPYVEIGTQVSYQIKINVSGSYISINCDNNQSMYTGYVVLEYTKTTD